MTRKDKRNRGIPRTIKLALVDDQPLFRSGINALLKDYDDLHVSLQASNGKDLIEQLKRIEPHVVLLDIEMPEMNGVETLLYLKENHPAIKVIMLTLHNEEEFIFDLMTKGAHGFIPKDKSVEEVVKAIYAVIETGKYYNKEINDAMMNGSKSLVKALPLTTFSDKEMEVLKLTCKQKTTKEIAESMGISFRTVEKYRASIQGKTGTKNVPGMIIYALKHKLITTIDMI